MAIRVNYLILRSLVIAGVLLAMLALSMDAEATPQRRLRQSEASKVQGAVCEAGGGVSTTTDGGMGVDTGVNKGPQIDDTTTCTGGLFDGMNCTNYENFSNCSMSHQVDGNQWGTVANDLAPLEATDKEPQPSPVADESIVADEQIEVVEDSTEEPVVDEVSGDVIEESTYVDPVTDEPVGDPTASPIADDTAAPDPTVVEPVEEVVADTGTTVDTNVIDTLQPLEVIDQLEVDSTVGQIG